GSAAEAAAADAAGLAYTHIPVESRNITHHDTRRFQEAVDASPGPFVAHCRSGARFCFLWIMIGDLEGKRDDEILALASEIDLDPKAVAARLEARRNALEGRT
ncbi:MAG TPA: sulfur transferase domain-containing protein, partial [Rhizomicrobium sp.]